VTRLRHILVLPTCTIYMTKSVRPRRSSVLSATVGFPLSSHPSVYTVYHAHFPLSRVHMVSTHSHQCILLPCSLCNMIIIITPEGNYYKMKFIPGRCVCVCVCVVVCVLCTGWFNKLLTYRYPETRVALTLLSNCEKVRLCVQEWVWYNSSVELTSFSLYKVIVWYLEWVRPVMYATPENLTKYFEACRVRIAKHHKSWPDDPIMVPLINHIHFESASL
jgi:hypothetical protein